MGNEVRSLWEVFDSEIEPWRRGRMALILFGVLAALSQLLGGIMIAMSNRLDLVIGLTIWCALFWLEFYLIWIGVARVRWLAAAVLMLSGFAQMIWVLENYSGLQLVIGAFNLGLGAYVGFAPSVFFFARRQREKRDLLRTLMTGAVFLLLIASLIAGSVGLRAINLSLQREADDFARASFDRLFVDHDVAYLKQHSSSRHSSPDVFVWKIKDDLGRLEQLEAPHRQILSQLSWHGFELRGSFLWRAKFEFAQKVSIRLDIAGDARRRWEIEHVNWIYD